jgi:hypothetical protein
MEILETTGEEYRVIIPRPYHEFNTVEFNLLNRCKCDNVLFFLFRDRKYHLGLVCGLKDGVLMSPFSAPYGGFSYLRGDIGIFHMDRAVEALLESSRKKGIASIVLTLPPPIYEASFISKMINCLFRHGFVVNAIEMNHVWDLLALDGQSHEAMSRDARRKMGFARAQGLTLRCCDTLDGKQLAYRIIEDHKRERGYPMRMTWEQVKETAFIIQTDFFLLADSCGQEIASAIVFHTQGTRIAQVIYWGDIRQQAELGTMDCLAVELRKHYKDRGFRYVDLGVSTEGSVPNYGLCRFKEGVGCITIPKILMTRRI